MKLLFDFLPIVLFFATFKVAEGNALQAAEFATRHFGFLVSGGVVGAKEGPVLLATLVVIIATLAQIVWLALRRRKVDAMLWTSLALVTVLGGATVWFHNETFIKWKPSALYWAMGLGLLASQALWRKNLLQAMLGDQLRLPAAVWQRLNLAWVAFFAAMGVLNLYVAYTFSTDAWVNFKLFGGLGLMLAFTLAQGVYLNRYLNDDPEGDPKDDPPKPLHETR